MCCMLQHQNLWTAEVQILQNMSKLYMLKALQNNLGINKKDLDKWKNASSSWIETSSIVRIPKQTLAIQSNSSQTPYKIF